MLFVGEKLGGYFLQDFVHMVEISIDSKSLEFCDGIVFQIVMTDPFIIIQSNSASVLQNSRKLVTPISFGIISQIGNIPPVPSLLGISSR